MKYYFIHVISVLNFLKQFDVCYSMKLKENVLESKLLHLPIPSKNLSLHRYGYVIAVTSIDNIDVGKIQPGKNKDKLLNNKKFDFILRTWLCYISC